MGHRLPAHTDRLRLPGRMGRRLLPGLTVLLRPLTLNSLPAAIGDTAPYGLKATAISGEPFRSAPDVQLLDHDMAT